MEHQVILEAERKVGGIFRLTALLQKRVRELVKGARPLVETDKVNPIDVALEEVIAGLITLEPDLETPETAVVEEELEKLKQERKKPDLSVFGV